MNDGWRCFVLQWKSFIFSFLWAKLKCYSTTQWILSLQKLFLWKWLRTLYKLWSSLRALLSAKSSESETLLESLGKLLASWNCLPKFINGFFLTIPSSCPILLANAWTRSLLTLIMSLSVMTDPSFFLKPLSLWVLPSSEANLRRFRMCKYRKTDATYMRPRSKELIPMATYSVTVSPEEWDASEVWAFGVNWTSVTSATRTFQIYYIKSRATDCVNCD